MTFKIVAISAGLSDPSSTRMLADRITDATRAQLVDASVETVTLRGLAHVITNVTLTGFASPRLQQLLDSVMAADAPIAVTPSFKAS